MKKIKDIFVAFLIVCMISTIFPVDVLASEEAAVSEETVQEEATQEETAGPDEAAKLEEDYAELRERAENGRLNLEDLEQECLSMAESCNCVEYLFKKVDESFA